MGVPKTFVGRGTYEGLGAASTVVQQSGNGQTGKGLRESMSARSSELSAAPDWRERTPLCPKQDCPLDLTRQWIVPPQTYLLSECSDRTLCARRCDDLARTKTGARSSGFIEDLPR